MNRHFFQTLVAGASFLILTQSGESAQVSLIQNGGFEDGPAGLSIPGWSSSANTIVADSSLSGVTPYEGNYMAVMSVGATFDSYLSQPFSPGTGYDTFDLSFAFNLAALDFSIFDSGIDTLSVSVGTATLFYSLNDLFDFNSTTTGWQEVSFQNLSVAGLGGGNLSISFNVENIAPGWGDSGQLFQAHIDSVSATAAVPDSGTTVLLLGLSLLAIGVFRWKSRVAVAECR